MPGRHIASTDPGNSVEGEAYRVTLGADADGTYSVSTTDIVRVGFGTLSQNRTYTVDALNTDVDPNRNFFPVSHDGVVLMKISRTEDAGAHTLTIKDGPSGITLTILSAFGTGPSWCTLCFHGANWHVLEIG